MNLEELFADERREQISGLFFYRAISTPTVLFGQERNFRKYLFDTMNTLLFPLFDRSSKPLFSTFKILNYIFKLLRVAPLLEQLFCFVLFFSVLRSLLDNNLGKHIRQIALIDS